MDTSDRGCCFPCGDKAIGNLRPGFYRIALWLTVLIAIVYPLFTVSAELQNPDQATLLEVQARTALEEGRHKEATTLFRQTAQAFALQDAPIRQAWCLVTSGKVWIELRNYTEALIDLEVAGKIYEETPDAPPLDKGICLWQTGRALVNNQRSTEGLMKIEAAMDIFQDAEQVNQERAQCIQSKSSALYNLGRYEDALIAANEACRIFVLFDDSEAEQAQCLLNAGNALFGLRRYDEALHSYEKAQALFDKVDNTDGDQAICVMNSGAVFFELGRFQEALAFSTRAEMLFAVMEGRERERAMCFLNKGNALYGLGRYEEARTLYEKAMESFALVEGADIQYAKCIMNIGLMDFYLRRYEQSLESEREAERLFADLEGADTYEAMCILNAGNALYGLGRYEAAMQKYETAAKRFADLEDATFQYATCLMNAGLMLFFLRRYEEALETEQEAEQLFATLRGAERDKAMCVLNAGNALYGLGRYEEAFQRYASAAEQFAGLDGADYHHATSLMNMGLMSYYLSRNEEALDFTQKAKQLFAKLAGTEHDQATCILNEGTALYGLRRYEAARQMYEEAYRCFLAVHGSERNQASCLMNMALMSYFLGRYEDALDMGQEAHNLFASLEGTAFEQASCSLNRGNAFWDSGRYAEARDAYEEALAVFLELDGAKREQATCKMNIGMALCWLSQYEASLESFEKAFNLFSSLAGTQRDMANCTLNKGNALYIAGRFSEARDAYEVAKELFEEQSGTEYQQAICMMNMGMAHYFMQQFEDSLAILQEARTLFACLEGAERETIRCLTNSCKVYQRLGEYQNALLMFEEARYRLAQLPGMEEEQSKNLWNGGWTYAALEKWLNALDIVFTGYQGLWRYNIANLPVLTEDDKITFLAFHLANPFAIHTLSILKGKDIPEAGRYGLDTSLITKGLVEWAMQQEQQVFLAQAPPDWQQEYEELQQWRREKASLSHALDDDLHRADVQDTPEAREARIKRLDTLNKQIAVREQDLARRNAAFAAEMKLQTVDTANVSAALSQMGPNTVLLEYVKYDEVNFAEDTTGAARYCVYILPAGSDSPVGIDLGPASAIDEAVMAFRNSIERLPTYIEQKRVFPRAPVMREMMVQYADQGAALRKLIFDPVLPYLETGMQLFVAPDADLFLLPFEALPSPNPQDSGVRYLVEDYGLVYLNSGRELLRFVNRSRAGTVNNTAAIVSDPDLKMSVTDRAVKSARWLEARARGEVPEAQPWQGSFAAGSQPTSIHDTAGSGVGDSLNEIVAGLKPIGEAALTFTITVNDLLHNKQHPWCNTLVTYVGEEALEERVASLSSPRLLQILSHGVFIPLQEETYSADDLDARPREIENPLLRSMLALAGASVPTEGHIYHQENQFLTETEWLALDPAKREEQWEPIPLDDGHLTAYEVSGMKLYDTELVALTACSTALGDVGMGSSVAGLRRAFIAAGAHSMIMAQWEVPVLSSLNQMEQFYDAWLGKSFGRYDAFWESQKQALAAARKDFCGHPWFWAGFIYIGDPGERKADSSTNQSS